MVDVATMQNYQIPAHSEPVKNVNWSPVLNTLITSSWDKTIKYWDLRASTPVATVIMPEKCYSMDVSNTHVVVGCAERHITIINLKSPTVILKKTISPLKWQTRVVSCYPNGEGYAIGSIEGRVSLNNFDANNNNAVFSFKCQRDDSNVYAVNAISFHPTYGTFSTAGSDGTYNMWDKDSKQRLKSSAKLGNSISATSFNRNGSVFAYALSYDWSKGFEHNSRDMKNIVMLSLPKDADIKSKSASSFVRRR